LGGPTYAGGIVSTLASGDEADGGPGTIRGSAGSACAKTRAVPMHVTSLHVLSTDHHHACAARLAE
jgi:hypothetical protein